MVVVENEKNYLASYKEHMLKVQVELIHMRKRTSEQYNAWKKDTRLRFLEGSICWLRDEAFKLATSLENMKQSNQQLKKEVDLLTQENEFMKEYTQCTKRQNLRLEKTIETLKHPENLRRYAEMQVELDKLNGTIPVPSMPFSPPEEPVMLKTSQVSGTQSAVFRESNRVSTAQDSLFTMSKSNLLHQRTKSGSGLRHGLKASQRYGNAMDDLRSSHSGQVNISSEGITDPKLRD